MHWWNLWTLCIDWMGKWRRRWTFFSFKRVSSIHYSLLCMDLLWNDWLFYVYNFLFISFQFWLCLFRANRRQLAFGEGYVHWHTVGVLSQMEDDFCAGKIVKLFQRNTKAIVHTHAPSAMHASYGNWNHPVQLYDGSTTGIIGNAGDGPAQLIAELPDGDSGEILINGHGLLVWGKELSETVKKCSKIQNQLDALFYRRWHTKLKLLLQSVNFDCINRYFQIIHFSLFHKN